MSDVSSAKLSAKQKRDILAQLAELGGKMFADDDIVFGTDGKLTIPKGMGLSDAVTFLERKIEEQTEVTRYQRVYPYRPWDGALAASRGLRRIFGSVSISGFFGAQMIDVPSGPNGETVQVPWGELILPILPKVRFGFGQHYGDDGPLFVFTAVGPREHSHEIEGIFNLVRDELAANSLYRGQAISAEDMPAFLDLASVDAAKIVYTDEVRGLLDANVNALLRHSDTLRENGVPLKRAVLLHGPFGTGKTLAGFLTAQEAVANGWTFIYVRPGRDNVFQAMATAKIYAPSVVFVEDVDTIADPEAASRDDVARLLEAFDGVSEKGREVMVILTTNHPDRLHKGLLRPGRLDAVIEIAELHAGDVRRLLEVARPDAIVEDWDRVTDACIGFTPSFVREAADRAYRFALMSAGGDPSAVVIDDQALVLAAHSLRAQLRLMDGAKTDKADLPPLDTIMRDIVSQGTDHSGTSSQVGELAEYIIG